MKAYTNRHNINRGYMKLEVWNEAIELLKLINVILKKKQKVDLKLSSQIIDAAQSVSSNIAEGYSRRTLKEYLQYLNVSLGSMSEVMTRVVGLQVLGIISDQEFEEVDKLHLSLENKLISLVRSLQMKKKTGTWEEEFA